MKKLLIVLLFMESDASYFCVTFYNLGWACLFVLLITKKKS